MLIFFRWYVFRSWGRVGTTIGGTKLDDFHSLNSAVAFFSDHYLEKTGSKKITHKAVNISTLAYYYCLMCMNTIQQYHATGSHFLKEAYIELSSVTKVRMLELKQKSCPTSLSKSELISFFFFLL